MDRVWENNNVKGEEWGSYRSLEEMSRVGHRKRCGFNNHVNPEGGESGNRYPDISPLPSSACLPPPLNDQTQPEVRAEGSGGPVHQNLPPSTLSSWGKGGGESSWSSTQINLCPGPKGHTKHTVATATADINSPPKGLHLLGLDKSY